MSGHQRGAGEMAVWHRVWQVGQGEQVSMSTIHLNLPETPISALCLVIKWHAIKLPADGTHESSARATLIYFGFQDCRKHWADLVFKILSLTNHHFSESLNHTCCTSKLLCVFLSAPREKSIKTIQDEIRSVIRQITATVTFLPLLDTPCKWSHISVLQEFCVSVSHWDKGPIFFGPSSLRCLWPPCLHRQRSGGAWKVGGVWTADHRPIWGGASALLHYLHPQGEQHGGIQEDGLVVHSSVQWAVYCAIFCPLEKNLHCPYTALLYLTCLHLCPIMCMLRSVSFSFWSSLFFFLKDVEAACYCPHRCKYFSAAEFWMLVPFVSFFFVLLPLKL